MTPGERIRQKRTEMQMSLRELGKRSGVTAAAISQWENGMTRVSSESLMNVAKSLKTTPEWIMNGDNKRSDDAETRRFIQEIQAEFETLSEEGKQDVLDFIETVKARHRILDKYKKR